MRPSFSWPASSRAESFRTRFRSRNQRKSRSSLIFTRDALRRIGGRLPPLPATLVDAPTRFERAARRTHNGHRSRTAMPAMNATRIGSRMLMVDLAAVWPQAPSAIQVRVFPPRCTALSCARNSARRRSSGEQHICRIPAANRGVQVLEKRKRGDHADRRWDVRGRHADTSSNMPCNKGAPTFVEKRASHSESVR